MHGGRRCRSAAPFHSTPDEKSERPQSVSGGGGGGLRRAVCDAVKHSCEWWPAGGAVRGAVVCQRGAAEGGEDPELAAAAAGRRPRGCVLHHSIEAAEGPAADQQSTATR